MIFARETIAEVWDEALPLMAAHAREIPLVHGWDAAPQRAMWERIEAAGALVVLVAREPACCALIGYSAFVLAPSLIYSASGTWASQAVLYVIPAHRGRTAVRFLRWQDERLTGLGCSVVIRGVSEHCDYSRTLSKMGYSPVSGQYFRRLNA